MENEKYLTNIMNFQAMLLKKHNKKLGFLKILSFVFNQKPVSCVFFVMFIVLSPVMITNYEIFLNINHNSVLLYGSVLTFIVFSCQLKMKYKTIKNLLSLSAEKIDTNEITKISELDYEDHGLFLNLKLVNFINNKKLENYDNIRGNEHLIIQKLHIAQVGYIAEIKELKLLLKEEVSIQDLKMFSSLINQEDKKKFEISMSKNKLNSLELGFFLNVMVECIFNVEKMLEIERNNWKELKNSETISYLFQE